MEGGVITNIFCIVVFGLSYLAFKNSQLMDKYIHFPYREVRNGEYIRLLTSGFLHGSWNHLLINLFVLWQFGAFVEMYFTQRFGQVNGSVIYVVFFLTAILASNMGTFIRHRDNPGFRSLGASGVTSAIILVYVLFNPWQMFLFPPVPAIVFAILYLGYSTWASGKHRDHIDHQAHLWGSLYGLLYILLIDPAVFSYFFKAMSDIPFLN